MNELHNTFAYLVVIYNNEHYEKTKEKKIIGYELRLARYAKEPSYGGETLRKHNIEFREFITLFRTKITKKKAKKLIDEGIKVTAGYYSD